jgi:hypothetical protein
MAFRKGAGLAHRRGDGAEARRDQLGGSISLASTKFSSTLQALYDGRTCIGHVISRGPRGVEAFDVDDNVVGLFPDVRTAADALLARGRR